MPIVFQHQPDPRLLGRVAQLAGEGAYRTRELNPLATSDANRNTSTQLSLLDLGTVPKQNPYFQDLSIIA